MLLSRDTCLIGTAAGTQNQSDKEAITSTMTGGHELLVAANARTQIVHRMFVLSTAPLGQPAGHMMCTGLQGLHERTALLVS